MCCPAMSSMVSALRCQRWVSVLALHMLVMFAKRHRPLFIHMPQTSAAYLKPSQLRHRLVPVATLTYGLLYASMQVDLHRHLTGSLPNEQVLEILSSASGEESRTRDSRETSTSATTPTYWPRSQPAVHPPPPMVTPDQGVSEAAQHEAWDLLIRQCTAVQVTRICVDDVE